MKLKKLVACVLCMFCVICLAGCFGKGDFRAAKWGASPKAVTRSENTDYAYAADDIATFYDKEYDKDAEIIYIFDEDGLEEAQAKFLVGDWILEDIIADYKKTAQEMTAEFGAPLNADYNVWKTGTPEYEEHKNDGEVYSMYYKVLEFKLEWEDERTYRSLSLNYKDEQINYVYYACPVSK
ncbi:MAG: hypothetical protein RR998_01605 [Oscillospiraceae bacterium]